MKKLINKILKNLDPWAFQGKCKPYHVAYAYEEPDRNAPHRLFSFFTEYVESNGFEMVKEIHSGAPRDRVTMIFERDADKIMLEYCIDRGCCVSSDTIEISTLYRNVAEQEPSQPLSGP